MLRWCFPDFLAIFFADFPLILHTLAFVRTLFDSAVKFSNFSTNSTIQKSEKLNMFLIYRPPSSGHNNLAELCEILRKADRNTVMIGDFNLPGTDWENEQSDAKGRELLDTVMEEGFEQLVPFPTHTKGNILDLLISNCPEKILDIEDVGRLGRSDHCMLKL